jgi:hypothetical protein
MTFFAKAISCWRVFIDEMSSPTTASPAGLIFMTMALSFVGMGDGVGMVLVFLASFLHLVLVVWFIYMSLAYQSTRLCPIQGMEIFCSLFTANGCLINCSCNHSSYLPNIMTFSWFANTIGIGLCAVKIWFYYPLAGHFLIAITLMLTFLYYPIR